MRMRRQLVSEGLPEPVLLLQGQVPCWWPRPLVSAFMSAAWLGLDLGSLFVTSEMAKAHSDTSSLWGLCALPCTFCAFTSETQGLTRPTCPP